MALIRERKLTRKFVVRASEMGKKTYDEDGFVMAITARLMRRVS